MVSPILAQCPHQSSENENTILLNGIDTLELTIGGPVSPSQYLLDNYELWDKLKSEYTAPDPYFCIEIGDKWFQLYPKSSGSYCYLLRNDEVGFIKVFHPKSFSAGVVGKQQIHLKLYSNYIHSYTDSQLIQQVYKIASYFVSDTAEASVLVSRADLHLDITNGDCFLSEEEIRNSISKSRFRDIYYGDNQVNFTEEDLEIISNPPSYNRGGGKFISNELLEKINLLVNNQLEIGADRIICGRELQTAYFGSPKNSIVWGKIYDKSVEISKKPNDFVKQLWIDNGYNGVDKVVRVEFSMKRDFIKQLNGGNYISLLGFVGHKSEIWNYLTNNWLRLVDKVEKNNSTRSIVSNFWKIIQSGYDTIVHTIVRKKTYNGNFNQLWIQGLGCIKQALSFGMVDNEDKLFVGAMSEALKKCLSSSYHSGEILERRKRIGIA